jgi:hypothetical protein
LSLLILLGVLFAALSVLCYQAYKPHWIMWANDTQMGALKAASGRLPDTYAGHWLDHWWIGMELPSSSPSLATILATFISPETYLKIFTPLSMMLLGFSAWLLFRQLRFAPMVCVLGGLAAGLNMHCFSNACWGLGTWNVCIAMSFLAVAALVSDSIRQPWIKAVLAGLAVGMGVMEGFDSGAILSVYIGVFVVFLCWITESGLANRIARSAQMGSLVVLFSVLIAMSTIATLIGTQIQGIAGAGRTDDKKEKWDFATEWSLPKLESLRVIIPGIFGYRMEEFMTSPDKSAAYWGRVGEDPCVAKLESSDPEVRAAAIAGLGPNPEVVAAMRSDNAEAHAQILDIVKSRVQRRHSGNGEYAGVLVALFAVFGLLNSGRGAASPYTRKERLLVWFWGLSALFSLMAAWGRFGFLYALLYKLPYVSSIRNPIKFMHPFDISWVILAGFGLEAFSRCYLRRPDNSTAASRALQTKSWWQKRSTFDKIYSIGLILAVGAFAAGYSKFAETRENLGEYISHQGFPKELASHVAAFSINEAAWFVFLLALSAALLLNALAGAWTGRRACWVWALFCGILVFDLGRADLPWVRYFDYDEKYSMNEITKILQDKPYEHRVVGRLSPRGPYDLPRDQNFAAVIHWWLENDFPYHDIQSLEIDQMSRMPVMEGNYLGALSVRSATDLSPAGRLWKLTNTRYLLASAEFLPALNQQTDPGHNYFQYVKRFNLVPKPGVTNVEDAGDLFPQITDQGTCALVEYTGALPRARLYSNWLTQTNDQDTLQTLVSPRWDPDQSVLVSQSTNDAPVPQAGANPKADAGAVRITDYNPRDIKLQASAKTPAVLLYNDRTAPAWQVWVDGKRAALLRCNYIMRGVFLPAGEHQVEFQFRPSLVPLYVTLFAFAVGLLLAAYLIWSHFAGKLSAKTA